MFEDGEIESTRNRGIRNPSPFGTSLEKQLMSPGLEES